MPGPHGGPDGPSGWPGVSGPALFAAGALIGNA